MDEGPVTAMRIDRGTPYSSDPAMGNFIGSSLFSVGKEGRQGKNLELKNSGKETEGSTICTTEDRRVVGGTA